MYSYFPLILLSFIVSFQPFAYTNVTATNNGAHKLALTSVNTSIGQISRTTAEPKLMCICDIAVSCQIVLHGVGATSHPQVKAYSILASGSLTCQSTHLGLASNAWALHPSQPSALVQGACTTTHPHMAPLFTLESVSISSLFL